MSTQEIIKIFGDKKVFTILDMSICWQVAQDAMDQIEEEQPIYTTFSEFVNGDYPSKIAELKNNNQ